MKKFIAFLFAATFFAAALPVQAGGVTENLLLSSAWCTFSYNQTTGYSSSKRIQFYRNGTYSMGSQAEGYSSGRSGSFASQNNSGGDGRWKVTGGELYISEGYGQLEYVNTVVKRNSSGYPIIVADGVEYSQCK